MNNAEELKNSTTQNNEPNRQQTGLNGNSNEPNRQQLDLNGNSNELNRQQLGLNGNSNELNRQQLGLNGNSNEANRQQLGLNGNSNEANRQQTGLNGNNNEPDAKTTFADATVMSAQLAAANNAKSNSDKKAPDPVKNYNEWLDYQRKNDPNFDVRQKIMDLQLKDENEEFNKYMDDYVNGKGISDEQFDARQNEHTSKINEARNKLWAGTENMTEAQKTAHWNEMYNNLRNQGNASNIQLKDGKTPEAPSNENAQNAPKEESMFSKAKRVINGVVSNPVVRFGGKAVKFTLKSGWKATKLATRTGMALGGAMLSVAAGDGIESIKSQAMKGWNAGGQVTDIVENTAGIGINAASAGVDAVITGRNKIEGVLRKRRISNEQDQLEAAYHNYQQNNHLTDDQMMENTERFRQMSNEDIEKIQDVNARNYALHLKELPKLYEEAGNEDPNKELRSTLDEIRKRKKKRTEK